MQSESSEESKDQLSEEGKRKAELKDRAVEDFYQVLGIRRDAKPEEINKAYRRLARKYHPDVNPGDKDAEQRFDLIKKAHDTLSDPNKRKAYDLLDGAGNIGFDGFDWGAASSTYHSKPSSSKSWPLSLLVCFALLGLGIWYFYPSITGQTSTSQSNTAATEDNQTKAARAEAEFQNNDDDLANRVKAREAAKEFINTHLPNWKIVGLQTLRYQGNEYLIQADINSSKGRHTIELFAICFFNDSGEQYWKADVSTKALKENLHNIEDLKNLEELNNLRPQEQPDEDYTN